MKEKIKQLVNWFFSHVLRQKYAVYVEIPVEPYEHFFGISYVQLFPIPGDKENAKLKLTLESDKATIFNKRQANNVAQFCKKWNYRTYIVKEKKLPL